MLSRRVSLPKCISPSGASKEAASKRNSIAKPTETLASPAVNAANDASSHELPAPLSVSVPAAALSPIKDPQLKDNAIKVVVRVRPLSEKELLARSPVVVNVSKTSVQVINPALFTDPTFLDAISTPSRKYSALNLPVSLPSHAITAANQAGECRAFHFDRCFGVDNAAANESEPFANAYDIDVATQRPNQELVFEEIGKDMIPSAFQGFNCTVFAYGQTGSGKTHTMVGEKSTMRGKGVIPRVCEALFQGIDARRVKENELADALEAASASAIDGDSSATSTGAVKKTVFTVHMSYCEIYKEKVHDLLDNGAATLTPTSSFSASASTMMSETSAPVSPTGSSSGGQRGKVLKVREHPVTGPFVEGLSSRLVSSYEEISEEMLAGDKLRTVAATLMNPVSSRSHAMFTLTLTQTTFDGVTNVPTIKTSKIALIDLAGSERANVSGTSGDRLKEGAMINKSLTTLGRVIAALSKASSASNERVPYRDSTLTWLLKESLGGNAKTTMIAMVSPAAENYDETMSTLRYAESAKRVMNRAVVNEDPNARIIRQLRDEIQGLRDQLATREKEAFYLAENLKDHTQLPPSVQDRDEFYHEMQDEMQNYKGQVEALLLKQTQHEEFLNKTSRVVRLHAEYPSLLNVKASILIGGDDVLACTLREGITLVGSEEPPSLAQAPGPGTKPVTQPSSPDEASAEAVGESKSPRPLARKTSWAGSFLKRRKSSTSSLATDTPGSVAEEGRAMSPRKGKLSRRSSRELAGPEAEPEEPTSFVRLVATAAEGDDAVLPKHALLIVHSRVVPLPSGDELTETVEDEIEYVVELQPISAATAVFVNDNRVAVDTRKRVVHGDMIGFGTAHRFRLHVPQVAAKMAAFAASKPVVSTIETQPPVIPLEDLVAEANAICDKWHLRMEFAVSNPPLATEENPQDEVLVKKHLGGKRYTIMKWSRATLEDNLLDLRRVAASLQPPEGQEAAILEEEEQELVTIHEVEEPEPKLSLARHADRVSEASDREESHDDDSRSTTQTRAVPASMSYMDGRYSTTIETTTAPGGHMTSVTPTVHPVALPPTLSIRQLGTTRVYLSGLLGSNNTADGPSQSHVRQDGLALSTAVYDSNGAQIARLHCHIRVLHDNAASVQAQGTKSDGETTGNPPKRGFSFLSPRGSQTATTTTPIPTGKSSFARVQIVVEHVEFTAAASEPQQISLTLKKWSVSDSTPAETDTTGAGPGVESTPKVSAIENAATHSNSFPINHTMQLTSVASDDFLSVEVWGYGDQPAAQLSPSTSAALAHKIELFVSVDIEERDADGFFRPVAVKGDGTLRLHVNQPRRVSLRITQADHGPLVLQDFCVARLSPPFSTRGATNLLIGDGKSTQSLLLPPPLLVAHGVAATSARSAATTEADELPTFKEWLRLFPRATAELDATSRSLNVSLRWEHSTSDPHSEVCDSEDARSVFRLAVAVKTSLSRVPIVVSKSIVTKLSTTSVTSSQRLAREWENSRTAWWARESFSRNYRLGTWYSVDVLLSSHLGEDDVDPTAQADAEDGTREGVDATTMLESPAAVVQVTRHINGLRRLELCFAMERVRQEIVTKYLTTRISDEYPLTLERAQECFEQLLAQDGHDDPPVVKVLQLDDRALYLRHKSNKEIFIALETGDASEFSGGELSETVSPVDHVTHFVSEPTALTADATSSHGGGGQMCGFLMFSTSVQLDESALVTPTSSVSPSASSNPLSWARNSLSNRLSWERRWFVLKRPFLYAYKSFARKEQIGVLDVAKCQLVVPTSSSNAAGSGRRPSLPGVVTRRGSKQDNSGQVGGSGGVFPFCFQLVSMAGSKCVVWSLQASTQAEMRAWLVAIDPLKIEAREAVVNATPEAIATGLAA